MKPVFVGIPEKEIEREKIELQKPALPNNNAKGIFKRVADIVVEDMRYFFGRRATREAIDKSHEDKMLHDAFMELFK